MNDTLTKLWAKEMEDSHALVRKVFKNWYIIEFKETNMFKLKIKYAPTKGDLITTEGSELTIPCNFRGFFGAFVARHFIANWINDLEGYSAKVKWRTIYITKN